MIVDSLINAALAVLAVGAIDVLIIWAFGDKPPKAGGH